ncbi:MAG: DNA translocase FtsK 4TM domain-containing protein [Candidatus Competibacter sp.]|nr:DNA translocase FtsK 4TM domain-containing protein [Candidatus Competibacter sp.]
MFRFLKGTLQEISFWLVVVIAVGMILALASFHVDDPAWTHTANVAKTHNLVGTAGAWFADINLYFFGYPAYWLPLSLLFAAWRLFRQGSLFQLDAEVVLFRVLGFAVALATACGLAALHLQPLPGTIPGAGSSGGLMGVHVGQFLTQAFGRAWGNVFMVALLLAGVTLSTGFSWLKLVDWIGGALLRSASQLGNPTKPPRRGRSSGRADTGGEERAKAAGASDKAGKLKREREPEPERSTMARLSGIAALARAWWSKPARRASTAANADGDAPSAESEADREPRVPVTGGWQAGRIEPVLNLEPERKGRGGAGRNEPARRAVEPIQAVAPDLTLVPSKVSAPGSAGRQPAVSGPFANPAADAAQQRLWAAEVDCGIEASNEPMKPKLKAAKARPAAAMLAAPRLPVPEAAETEWLPALDLLDQPPPRTAGYSSDTLQDMSRQVEVLLKSFGVEARVVAVEPGPVITRFEVDPAPGVKVSQISNLSKDLARGLSVISVRVVEVIPGKPVIGLEIPNRQRATVYLREVLEAPVYVESPAALTLALGMDIGGNPVVANLAKMPHLLVAGTTGSGKSVAINAMLLSLLYKAPPAEVRLILVDPKMLELSMYEDIPHLLTPVVTDMKEAANALRWCVGEMERRYRLMAALKVRNIAGFNRKVLDALEEGEGLVDPFWKPEEGPGDASPPLEPLPFIVVVIDELADMMMIVGKKVEELIARLAQKARAAGIHLILATQRPSVDVITGLIKANIPTRIAFQVSSKVDSRTILDQMGAEQLLGHGDMLYLPPGTGLPQRVHGAFVDDQEVNRVVDFLRQTGAPDYIEEVLVEPREDSEFGEDGETNGRGGESDPLYDEAVRIVTESRRASVSGVQRRLRIGYNRAARLVEEMESAGVVGPLQSNGSREVLAPAPP